MSTHKLISPRQSRKRKLLEPCDFCDAVAGEPCSLVASGEREFICPDQDCEQLYDNSRDALSCTIHFIPTGEL